MASREYARVPISEVARATVGPLTLMKVITDGRNKMKPGPAAFARRRRFGGLCSNAEEVVVRRTTQRWVRLLSVSNCARARSLRNDTAFWMPMCGY